MAIKTETVPQLYNLALATSVIVTVGDAVQDLIEKHGAGGLDDGSEPVLAALLAYVLLWSTKIFVDDNQVLLHGKSRGWHGLDLLFLVVSYSLLISAAAALTSEYFLGFLAGHFVTLIAWVLTSYLCTLLESLGWLKKPCGPVDTNEPDHRRTWLTVDLLSLGAIVVMWVDGLQWPATAALYLLMAVDVMLSGTLAREKLVGIADAEKGAQSARKGMAE